jgi:hypothetical protein
MWKLHSRKQSAEPRVQNWQIVVQNKCKWENQREGKLQSLVDGGDKTLQIEIFLYRGIYIRIENCIRIEHYIVCRINFMRQMIDISK